MKVSECNVPINKGNYSMDTPQRESLFEGYRGEGWEHEYAAYRNAWVECAQKQIVSDYPLLVDIELSSLCNLKCPMCYTTTDIFKKLVNAKFMEWDLYQKIINEIGGKVPAIRLSLRGEATLHAKFVEAINYAKKMGIKEVSTLTNGSKLTPSFIKKIIDAGIDWITISVDGTGATYETIRNPMKFNDLFDNIKEIKRVKDECNRHRPVIKVQGIWPAIKEDPQRYYDTFVPYADLIAFNPLIDYLDNDADIDYLDSFTCPQQYQRLVIGSDGLVMKCSNDEENREIIGDVNKESIYQVWHGKNMTCVREMHKRKQGFLQSSVCRKCYLPRKTEDGETAKVSGREFIILNYINRAQEIGS